LTNGNPLIMLNFSQKERFFKVAAVLAGMAFLSISCSSTKTDSAFSEADSREIQSLLSEQQEAWNRGNIPAFMEGYHRSDSMQFVGSSGITKGWEQTLKNYQIRYPDTVAMGKLRFDILKINGISNQAAWLTGKFYLKRSIGDANGTFTLVLKKFSGEWKIVYDHTGN